MRPIIVLVLLASLAACGSSTVGTCSIDAECKTGSVCDAQQHVCVVGGAVTPQVTLTAPASGAVADGTLTAAATAQAPGGVTALSFEVRSTAGALLASAPGTAAASDRASFSATVPLGGAPDGSAIVQAVITYGSGQKLTSTAVQIQLDQRPPSITLQTDGRTRLFAGGQTATVTAQIADGPGSGVVDSSVVLRIAGHADVPGTGSAGIYSFTVAIDDSLAAAGTSVAVPFQILATDRVGHTATLAGDARAVLRIDRDAPRIAEIAVTTDPGFTMPNGTKVFDPGGGLLKVRATITDGAGLDESTVCLRAAGETGACPHLGTNHGAGNLYDFDLPPPVGKFDGEAVSFTVSADDAFAAALPDGPKTEHQAATLPQPVVYDNTPPVVTVTADTSVYARSGTIDVVATITDGTGVLSAQLVSRTAAPVTIAGNVYTFKLNAGDAPLLLDQSFAFQVKAQDNLGHSISVGASREIDGAPPALSVQIFRSGDPLPANAGVTYPVAVASTGWTGSTFIYSDKVHVHGTLTDRSGVGAASLHVDGTSLLGLASAGVRLPLDSCAPGATTCSFDIDVNLNAPGNGEFHSINPNVDNVVLGVDSIPAGLLQIAIDAQDTATSFGSGTPGNAPNKGTQSTPVQATRLLWEQTVAGTAVTGLAIHPSGEVIVTTSGAAGDLYALAPDQPLQLWSATDATTGTNIGEIIGTPAIGIADGLGGPRIYVASAVGVLYAFEAKGSPAWTIAGAPFSVGPAVTTVGTPAIDEIVIPDAAAPAKNGAPVANLWRATSAADVSSVPSDEQDLIAAPMILGGNVYFATQHAPKSTTTGMHVTMHPLNPDGSLGAFTNGVVGGSVVDGVDPFFGLVTDGTSIYAATNGKTTGTLFGFDALLSQTWKAPLAQALAAGPTFGADGKLYGSDVAKNTSTYNLTTGVPTTFVSAIGGVGLVPLHGSGGHVYFPSNGSQALRAYKGKQFSWQLGTAANSLRYAVIDCQGRLFSAAGNTVYAFVTDDRGLADTPWPNLRRDSRNTGNAGAVKYGMRTADGGCIQ